MAKSWLCFGRENNGRGSLEKTTEGNLRRNGVFWNRKNSLEIYDDVELFDFVVTTVLTIVDEMRNDLE